jgi:hypothetical protein
MDKKYKPIQCDNLIRLGINQDGGYIATKDEVLNAKTLVTLGIDGECSFEEHFLLLNPHINIKAYDRSVSCHTSFEVIKKFVGPDISFNEIMKDVEYPCFFKCDIEGAELHFFNDLLQYNFNEIIIEFHSKVYGRHKEQEMIDALLHNYYIAHIHGNNYEPCDLNLGPLTLEITFINKSLIANAQESAFTYPIPNLDYPNYPHKMDYQINFEENTSIIPKIIHWNWLGPDKIPNNTLEIMKSWNILKNEGWIENKITWDTLPNEVKIPWVRQAYEAKKYASASDYIRLWQIYINGGFYFDTDVEVKKSFPLEFISNHNIILGIQYDKYLECGAFGASKGNKYIKKIMEWYESHNFDIDYLNKFCKILPEPLRIIYTAPNLWTRLLYDELKNNEIQILPFECLSAKNYGTKEYTITENTFTVHHFEGSWIEKKEYNLNDFGFIN